MDIRFLSGNKEKIKEYQKILEKYDIRVISFAEKIEELQTKDTEKLINDKLIKAFKKIGRPIFVEHTALYLEYMNNFPGGLTQIFWDSLEADKFCELFGNTSNTRAIARTIIGYCDGAALHYFIGEIGGRISNIPKGSREFQWDCVFIPDGYDKTFAELGEAKNEISMRKKALDNFITFLSKEANI